jgi:hypothetical protein
MNDERLSDAPSGPRSTIPSAATHEQSRRGSLIPGNTLAERVAAGLEDPLRYSDVEHGDVRRDLFALNPSLAARYWRIVSNPYSHLAGEKADLIGSVKAVEPARLQYKPGSWEDIVR